MPLSLASSKAGRVFPIDPHRYKPRGIHPDQRGEKTQHKQYQQPHPVHLSGWSGRRSVSLAYGDYRSFQKLALDQFLVQETGQNQALDTWKAQLLSLGCMNPQSLQTHASSWTPLHAHARYGSLQLMDLRYSVYLLCGPTSPSLLTPRRTLCGELGWSPNPVAPVAGLDSLIPQQPTCHICKHAQALVSSCSTTNAWTLQPMVWLVAALRRTCTRNMEPLIHENDCKQSLISVGHNQTSI